MWGQLEIQGTPYGHFAQACEAGKNCRTSVKKGNFVRRIEMNIKEMNKEDFETTLKSNAGVYSDARTTF
jgi:hypothetical protein